MSQAPVDVMAAQPIFSPKLKGWLKQGRHRLYAYRPRFRNRHFWVIQGLIILIEAMHDIAEAGGFLHDLGVPYFIPLSLFLVPVVYAALTFGFAGALATALWATVITIPNFVLWHQGWERFGVVFQMLIVILVAIFVGQRVEREKEAWQRLKTSSAALKNSNVKYQGLLESSPIAILLIDLNGAVLEANPAASILFGKDKATLASMRVADLIGTAGTQKLLGTSQTGGRPHSIALKLKDGLELYIESSLTEVGDDQGNSVIQLLLRDVTEEHQRQAGLRAYAARVMHAHEEERQRIARELHDETIQTLVLLCRQLDSVEGDSESLPSPVIDKLREARRTAEEIVKGLRDFAKALRPPILDDLGMVASVRRLLADFTERTRVKGQLKVAGEDQRLPSDTELGLFRIAQEALWNVERHAGATRVAVTITFAEHRARLDVVDNGTGF